MSIELFKKLLSNIEKPQLSIKNHFLERVKQRNLNYDEIIENVLQPKYLIDSIIQSKNETETKFLNTYQKKGYPKYCYVIIIRKYEIILVTAYQLDNNKTKLYNRFKLK